MKKQYRNFIAAVFITVFAVVSTYAQITSAEVDRLVEDALKKFNVAGAAVGIVKDGKVIHSKGYGIKSVATNEKANEHTQFGIASNSKSFTAAALAILVDEGKVSWDDKVIKHIPEFKMYDDYVTENFTIIDLLTHRSGLGIGAGDLMLFPTGTDFTMKDLLVVFRHFKPKSAFRTKYDYDNILYFVAGEVIARASGMPWRDFIQTRIMKPLEMDNSLSMLIDTKDKGNLAAPHKVADGKFEIIGHFLQDPSKMNGAPGSIYSSADDMTKWLLVNLNSGKYGKTLDKRLYSEKRQEDMWTIHTVQLASKDPRYNSHFRGYGLGWGLTDVKGNLSVSHTGAVPGMLSKTTMIPDLNLGVVVLTNSNTGGGLFLAVSQTIVDSYLGLDDNNWTDKYVEILGKRRNSGDSVTEEVWKTVRAAKSDHIKPSDYIGIYEDNWFGKIKVFLKDNKLWFQALRSPQLNGEMEFYKDNTFAIKWEYQDLNADALAIFSVDKNGRAQSIKMKGISPNIDFSFDFQDLDLKRVKN